MVLSSTTAKTVPYVPAVFPRDKPVYVVRGIFFASALIKPDGF